MKPKHVAFFFSGLVLLVVLIAGVLHLRDSQVSVENSRFTNITDTAITLTWQSQDKYIGKVYYAKADSAWSPVLAQWGKQNAIDDRDIDTTAQERFTHHVTIRDLEPNTEYSFRVGGAVSGRLPENSTAKTSPIIETLTTPDPAYGLATNTNTNDAVVIMTLKDDATKAISTVLSQNSSYSIDINPLSRSLTATNLKLEVRNESRTVNDIIFDKPSYKPLQTVILNQDRDNNGSTAQELNQSLLPRVDAQAGMPWIATCVRENGTEFTTSESSPSTQKLFNDTHTNLQPGDPTGEKCGVVKWRREACQARGGKPKDDNCSTCFNDRDYCSEEDASLLTRLTRYREHELADAPSTREEEVNPQENCKFIPSLGKTVCTPENPTPETTTKNTCSGGSCLEIIPVPVNCIGGGCKNNPSNVCMFGRNDTVIPCNTYSPQACGCSWDNGKMYCSNFSTQVREYTVSNAAYKVIACNSSQTSSPPPVTQLTCQGVDNKQYPCAELVACGCERTATGQYSCAENNFPQPNANTHSGWACRQDLVWPTCRSIYIDENNKRVINAISCETNRLCGCEKDGNTFYCQGSNQFISAKKDNPNETQCEDIPKKSDQLVYRRYSQLTGNSCVNINRFTTTENDALGMARVRSAEAACGNTKQLGRCGTSNYFLEQVSAAGSTDTQTVLCNQAKASPNNSQVVNRSLATAAVLGAETGSSKSQTITEPGRYKFNINGSELETDVVFSEGKVELKAFKDTNNNGTRDSDEPYLDSSSFNYEKTDSALLYTFTSGWNIIAVPLVSTNSDNIRTASQLLSYWNKQNPRLSLLSIARYRNGSFEVYTQREDANSFAKDFSIVPGEGLLVFNKGLGGEAKFVGSSPEQSIPINVSNGWNLVGIAKSSSDKLTAGKLLSQMNQSKITATISSYLDSGNYRSVVLEDDTLFGTDYNLSPVKGYFIKVNSGGGTQFTPE